MEVLNFSNDIRISNELNEARYCFGVMALDILHVFLANIKKDDKEFHSYNITISDLEKRMGRRLNRDSLKKAANELSTASITFKNHDSSFTWFEKFIVNSSEGFIEAKFSNDLTDHLLQLKNKFTLGYFDVLSHLKSGYSKRIYLLMCQYGGMKERTLSVEELNSILSTPKSFQNSFGNFKLKILEPAISDIKKLTALQISIQEIKHGRFVAHLTFMVNGSKKKNSTVNNEKIEDKTDLNIKKGVTALDKWLQDNIV